MAETTTSCVTPGVLTLSVDLDVCSLCDCARVPEDDDGHGSGSGTCWATVRGRRICGACVFETLLARLERLAEEVACG